jgi:hypothetical protein
MCWSAKKRAKGEILMPGIVDLHRMRIYRGRKEIVRVMAPVRVPF